MAEIKVVFFDVGSVLLKKQFDPHQQAAALFGVERDELWKATGDALDEDATLIPPPYTVDLAQERVMAKRLMSEAARRLNVDVSNEVIQQAADGLVDRTYALSPGAVEVLTYLKPRYRLGLITNAAPSRRLDLRSHDLEQWFDPLVISAEVGKEKPNVDIYHHALDAAQIGGAEAAFIDNSPRFLDGARKAGITLTVLYDPGSEHSDSDHRTIESLEELKDLF